MAKKLSHRSSRPAPHGAQKPHGMMNAEATRVPTAGPATPGPSAATVPEISCPMTAGVGNATSAFITCRSVWQTPQACTLHEDLAGPRLGDGNLLDAQPAGGALEHGGFIVCIGS